MEGEEMCNELLIDSLMDSEEVHNKLLANIHNRLAEISKFLEIGIALFAKLDALDLQTLKKECSHISVIGYDSAYLMAQQEDCNIGYSLREGLYRSLWSEELAEHIHAPFGRDDKKTHNSKQEDK